MEIALGLFILSLFIPIIIIIYFSFLKNKYYETSLKKEYYGCTIASELKENEDVYIIKRKGIFFDNYDFTRNTIKLSENVYDGESYFYISLAAFLSMFTIESKYINLRIKTDNIVKILNISSYMLCLISLFMDDYRLMMIGAFINFVLLAYYFYCAINNKVIADLTFKKLKDNKIINNKEEGEIKFIFDKLPYIELMKLITNIFDIGV